MRAVLMSIKPKWCELIASGKKTVEVRKSTPKLETPFKVYIYCTKDNTFAEKTLRGFSDNGKPIYHKANKGKVIGEFVCDQIEEIGFSPYNHGEYICKVQSFVKQSCIPFTEMFDYLADGYGYGWHISDLVIYDKPIELSELKIMKELGSWIEIQPIRRPPQSWCYVV